MQVRAVLPVLLVLVPLLACRSLPARGDDEAVVSIGQPTVYMRERSLVERFDDLEWLRRQRSESKEQEYEQGFQGSVRTATAELTGFALKLALGETILETDDATDPAAAGDRGESQGQGSGGDSSGGGGGAPGGSAAASGTGASEAGQTTSTSPSSEKGEKKESGASKDEEDLLSEDARAALEALGRIANADLGKALDKLNATTPTLSPRDKLVNRIAFRDTVAEEIRRRSLDDVHDLEGMALYEVQFDLSLVAGANSGQTYAVLLEVTTQKKCESSLDEPTAKRVVEIVKADCVAEIEETTARYSERLLTTANSTHVHEAVLRGELAVRYEDLLQVVAAMGQGNPVGDSTSKEVPWLKWPDDEEDDKEEALSRSGFLDRILVTGKLEDAQLTVAAHLALCEELLREFAESAIDLGGLGQGGPEDTRGADEHLPLAEAEGVEGGRGFPEAEDVHGFGSTSVDLIPQARRSDQEQREWGRLIEALKKGKLSTVGAERLTTLLRTTNDARSRRYATRALGFVIARAAADGSGNVLKYRDPQDSAGLDAETLLPLILVGQEDCRSAWELPGPRRPRVVSVTPGEVAEQVSTAAYSDVRKALSAVLDGTFGGTVAQAGAAFERASQELRQYGAIGRNPLLVGFVGGDVDQRSGGPNTFGWVLGPRLETSTSGLATLGYRQV